MVTTLLRHLFDLGRIDGAVVTRQVGPFQRQPWLATDRQEILEAAGFHFDTSHGPSLFSEAYSTFSPSIVELEDVARQHLSRVAFVGTPCPRLIFHLPQQGKPRLFPGGHSAFEGLGVGVAFLDQPGRLTGSGAFLGSGAIKDDFPVPGQGGPEGSELF